MDVNTGDLLEHRHLIKGLDKAIWNKALANDIGRLAQGVSSRVTGTNTMLFIHPRKIPKHKKRLLKIGCNYSSVEERIQQSESHH